MNFILQTIVTVGLCCLGGVAAGGEPVMAGAYYFDGWTSGSSHLKKRLLTEFSQREPLTGWHDDSLPVIEKQIDDAADAGLGFFVFDWYYPEGPVKATPLNSALHFYLEAKNQERLKFCLMVANHGGMQIGPADWNAVCSQWIELFKQPTYLRVNDKPLLIFFSGLEDKFGSADNVKAAFNELRSKAKDAGLEGVTIAVCTFPGPANKWNDLNKLAASGFDYFTGYNYAGHPANIKGCPYIFSFLDLIKGHEEIWERFAQTSPIPYIPVVTSGWDDRPWEDASTTSPANGMYYPDRTAMLVGQFVEQAIQWLDRHPDKTSKERVMLIYAWNELGEGGYILPTKEDDGAVLRAISEKLKK